jgi:hypothetical protein
MDQNQIKIMSRSFAIVVLIWILSATFFSISEPSLPLNKAPLSFSARNAYQSTGEFVTLYPKRTFGSLESRQSSGYLQNHLTKLGYTVEYIHFDARIGGHKRVGRNMVALKQGKIPEVVALIAHYDTAETTEQGAMKNGAAVGVLLELARIFAQSPTHRSLLFVFSDGSEGGMLGAEDLAENFAQKYGIAAVLSLDYVASGDLAAFRLGETGQLSGFTPVWLRQLAIQAIQAQGISVWSASGLGESLERAFMIPRADQAPFLRAGIPAINLGSISTDPGRERALYNSPLDTVNNLKVVSINKYGLAAEQIVRSLDGLPAIPKESPDSFSLGNGRFLGAHLVVFLQILWFAPFLILFWLHWKQQGARLNLNQIGRELLALSGTFLPFLALFLSILLARSLRLLPSLALYSSSANDPVLENPPWGLFWGIFGAAILVAVISYLICKFLLKSWPKPEYKSSKLILISVLLITLICSLRYNSYWAWIFLLLPAWSWTAVGLHPKTGKKIRNGLVILAAGIPYYVVLWRYASNLGLGWNFAWYHVLAISTGFFTSTGYFLGSIVIALGIRFLAIQGNSQDS